MISVHPFDFEHAARVQFAVELGSMPTAALAAVARHGAHRWYRDAAIAELARRRALS